MSGRDERTHLTAGIDPGASSVKIAILRSRAGEDAELLAASVQRIRRRDVRDVVASGFADACAEAGVTLDDFDYVASTGDGDAVDCGTGHFYSMTTHARGALHLAPDARAALDAGALHARAIAFDGRGKVGKVRMTSQCASGSGQFVENITRYLGVPLEDVGALSLASQEPEKCSGVCAVLAETDVINMVSRGISTPDILKGIHLSIASKLARLVRAVGAEGEVLVTGGMAHDAGFLAALREVAAEKQRGEPVEIELVAHPESILAGALGAAILGAYRHRQLEEMGRLSTLAA
ncbi:MAG TPA: BadF/BadG/BcrA/BcrD ATPase family protein [Thermoanaerobaculia bacterium]